MKKRISSFIEKSFFSKTRKVKKIKRSQKNQGMIFFREKGTLDGEGNDRGKI